MSKKSSKRSRPLWHPALWPAWLGVFGLYLLSRLSMANKERWGEGIGRFLNRRLKSRNRVAKANIQACFPELSGDEQDRLVERCFVSCAQGFMTSTHAWWRDMEPYQASVEVIGLEHLEEAKARGKGVLLIGGHYNILDFALPLIACQLSKPGYMYRPNNNPVLDRAIEKGRRRHFNIQPFTKRQLPDMMQFLKEGGQVWYACDQDFGRKTEVYTPFFGVQAGCITTPSYIARESGASIICISHIRTESGGYQIAFSPIQEGFGEDVQKDTAAWNHFIETTIRAHPDQYLWLHKRFKSRPEGAEELY
ncbi:lysophospholipid acyltransferase family protein [Marinobacter caseinilyticus]|uniref:lysophospholipid acyltransferase family protein n=1 Tax=Marinobacter caseinilyticus TaxID=2692195 RepID=UPI001408A22B|nr:lysophospholipid acyltransferase family protein [Marinobacter caseinilyticus]